MRGQLIVGGIALVWTLACSGAGGAEGVGGSLPVLSAEPAAAPVGPYAQSLVDYYGAEHPELSLPAYHLGDEIPWGDFTVRFDEVGVADPWTGSPVGPDERSSIRPGMRALVLVMSVRNDSPVKKALGMWTYLRTPDGETNYWVQGNRAVFAKMRGIDDVPDDYPPGKWVKTPSAALVHADGVSEAAMYLTWEEERFDPTDPRGKRKIDVVVRHAVVDFGSPPDLGKLAPP